MTSLDSFKCRKTLKVGAKTYVYYSLPAAEKNGLTGHLQAAVLDEGAVGEPAAQRGRPHGQEGGHRGGRRVAEDRKLEQEIAFRPARVLMQDFTGVPAVVDLAAMRDAMQALGGDAEKINPLVPVDLVIDHSVIVNFFGNNQAFKKNVERRIQAEPGALRVPEVGPARVPEFLASCRPAPASATRSISNISPQTVWTQKEKMTVGKKNGTFEVAYPDTLVGTDSHTTMVNGLAVLGWGVGGIEAEAAMLGQPLSMLLPEVIGFKLTGKLKEGVTATDLVLTVTQMLRKKGVVGKFVEFFGPGLDYLSVADARRSATWRPNMARPAASSRSTRKRSIT